MSQQASAPGTDSPSHSAVIHLRQQRHFPGIRAMGLLWWGWGTRVLGQALWSPGLFLEASSATSTSLPAFKLQKPKAATCVLCRKGKQGPSLALQKCKTSPKC